MKIKRNENKWWFWWCNAVRMVCTWVSKYYVAKEIFILNFPQLNEKKTPIVSSTWALNLTCKSNGKNHVRGISRFNVVWTVFLSHFLSKYISASSPNLALYSFIHCGNAVPKIRFHHEVVYIQIYWISMAIWSVKKGQLKSTKNQHSLFFLVQPMHTSNTIKTIINPMKLDELVSIFH